MTALKFLPLGEIAKVSAGNSAPQAKDAFFNGVVPFIRTSDVGQVRKGDIADSRDRLPIEASKSYKIFPAGTILMPKSGASTFLNHRVVMRCEGAISSHLAGVIANPELVREEYLFHFLTLVDARDLAQDASYPSLNLGQIGSIQVPIPSLHLQDEIVQKIALVLDESVQVSENLATQAAFEEELWQASLSKVFRRFDDVDLVELGSVTGKIETTDPSKKPSEEFTYVDVSSIDNLLLEITEPQLLLAKDAPSRARRRIRKDDVIFATVRPTLKRMTLIAEEFDGQVCSTGYYVFRCNEGFRNKFLFYWLQSPQFMNRMAQIQGGASYPAVSDAQLKQEKIPLPSLADQDDAIALLENIASEMRSLRELRNQKSSLRFELEDSVLRTCFGVS